jgi:hypothetical protein
MLRRLHQLRVPLYVLGSVVLATVVQLVSQVRA